MGDLLVVMVVGLSLFSPGCCDSCWRCWREEPLVRLFLETTDELLFTVTISTDFLLFLDKSGDRTFLARR